MHSIKRTVAVVVQGEEACSICIFEASAAAEQTNQAANKHQIRSSLPSPSLFVY